MMPSTTSNPLMAQDMIDAICGISIETPSLPRVCLAYFFTDIVFTYEKI
jgi:hypothetical protein